MSKKVIKGLLEKTSSSQGKKQFSGFIKDSWFQWYVNLEDHNLARFSEIFITLTPSFSEKNLGSNSCVAVWAIMEEGLFLLDFSRGKLSYPDFEKLILKTWKKWWGDSFSRPLSHHNKGLYLSKIYSDSSLINTNLLKHLSYDDVLYRNINRKNEKLFSSKGSNQLDYMDEVELINSITPWISKGFVFLPYNNPIASKELASQALNFGSKNYDLNNNFDVLHSMVDAIRVGLESSKTVFLKKR